MVSDRLQPISRLDEPGLSEYLLLSDKAPSLGSLSFLFWEEPDGAGGDPTEAEDQGRRIVWMTDDAYVGILPSRKGYLCHLAIQDSGKGHKIYGFFIYGNSNKAAWEACNRILNLDDEGCYLAVDVCFVESNDAAPTPFSDRMFSVQMKCLNRTLYICARSQEGASEALGNTIAAAKEKVRITIGQTNGVRRCQINTNGLQKILSNNLTLLHFKGLVFSATQGRMFGASGQNTQLAFNDAYTWFDDGGRSFLAAFSEKRSQDAGPKILQIIQCKGLFETSVWSSLLQRLAESHHGLQELDLQEMHFNSQSRRWLEQTKVPAVSLSLPQQDRPGVPIELRTGMEIDFPTAPKSAPLLFMESRAREAEHTPDWNELLREWRELASDERAAYAARYESEVQNYISALNSLYAGHSSSLGTYGWKDGRNNEGSAETEIIQPGSSFVKDANGWRVATDGPNAGETSAAGLPEKYKKAPGAPKRSKSAFIIFSAEKHREIKEKLQQEGRPEKTTDIAKRVTDIWEHLSPGEKKEWELKAEQDMARYEAEKAAYKGPWNIPKKRVRANLPAPKRPTSAFIMFANMQRPVLKRRNPEATNADLNRMLSQSWKELDLNNRAFFMDIEREARDVYKTTMAAWRGSTN